MLIMFLYKPILWRIVRRVSSAFAGHSRFAQALKQAQTVRPGTMPGVDINMSGRTHIKKAATLALRPVFCSAGLDPGIVAAAHHQAGKTQRLIEQGLWLAKTIRIGRGHEQGAMNALPTDKSSGDRSQAAKAMSDDPDLVRTSVNRLADPCRPV